MADRLSLGTYAEVLANLIARAASAGFRVTSVTGISLGGCVEAIDTPRRGAFRRRAHAHNDRRDPHFGWLCFLSTELGRLITLAGRTALFAHEFAHLLAPGSGHGERWRRAVTALGYPAQARRP
ncbi:MAG: hypothetical protein LC118_08625 [Dehalococcoidia bacterium]|nr:hypothetical protein [Dehalococcoidia bacterium]